MSEQNKQSEGTVQTTGHAWDGDLQEFNNPLPRWWLWAFYATIVFSLLYWLIYPAWPIGGTYTKGVMNTITFKNDKGEEVTTHWNTRSLLIKDMQEGDEALNQAAYLQKVADTGYQQIISDGDMMAFTRSMAIGLFGDNCAACHQQGGAGIVGGYPTLADDDWLWGGSFAQIEATIRHGRHGYMPDFSNTFNDEQLDQIATYVLSLSGHDVDQNKAKAGGAIFNGEMGGCYYCHDKGGIGMRTMGSANLTDQVWTIANIPEAEGVEAKKAAIKHVIRNGVYRKMPAWQGRLSDTEIKLLTTYVHELGGGK
jgi:cytochrome c oxidase cbb3-type subunit 3